ncbi:MAG TPA: transcription antitermination factor NusB [Chthoniobacterales bacterium]
MGKRREGREAAIQFLYNTDLNHGENAGTREDFWDLRPAKPNIREFATTLIDGVTAHLPEIDERIQKYAENYQLSRMLAVDRNILRLAIYEMVYCTDVPPVVAINEAIEIAKRFGADESSRFVNGILDRIKFDLARPLRTAGSVNRD